jgi:FkbM family methyltransferase
MTAAPLGRTARIKYLANTFRNGPVASAITREVLGRCVRSLEAGTNLVRTKFWVNGGELEYQGLRLVFPQNVGVHFSSSIFWKGDAGFEPAVWRSIRCLLTGATGFADVGSNIGLYTVLVAKQFPGINTHAFEPVPSLARKHEAFCKANAVSGVSLHEVALSDRVGVQVLHLPDSGHVEEEQTATLERDSWQARDANRKSFDVSTVRLDDFCRSHEWWPDVVKIDVEGHEFAVLLGCEELMSKHRSAIVCEVLDGADNSNALTELLIRHGYASYAVLDHGLFRQKEFITPRPFEYFVFLPALDLPDYLSFGDLQSHAGSEVPG